MLQNLNFGKGPQLPPPLSFLHFTQRTKVPPRKLKSPAAAPAASNRVTSTPREDELGLEPVFTAKTFPLVFDLASDLDIDGVKKFLMHLSWTK